MFCKHKGCKIEWKLIFDMKLFILVFVSGFSCFLNCEAFQVKLDKLLLISVNC